MWAYWDVIVLPNSEFPQVWLKPEREGMVTIMTIRTVTMTTMRFSL